MLFEGFLLVRPGSGEAAPRPGQLRVGDDGRIAAVRAGDDPGPALVAKPGEQVVTGAPGELLTPGFVDLHVHGAAGRDAMEATPEAFAAVCRFHARRGTTALALTTVAAPRAELARVVAAAAGYRQTAARPRGAGASPDPGSAAILGVHLEGPSFSAARAGAHDPRFLRAPDREELASLLEASRQGIVQVTLAPELPGSLAAIEFLRRRRVLVSAGHSDAWEEEVQAAFGAGLQHVTHVFNAMSSARRRGPYRVAGLLECALAEPEVTCEVIADGHHVGVTLLKMLWRAKGPGGICLVSDASAGTGLPEGAAYRLGAAACVVGPGVGLTHDRQALAGSTSTLADGVRHLVRGVGVPVTAAVRMATLNPARRIGQEKERGQLEPGGRGDLVALSPGLEVRAVWVGGTLVE